jgi:hypothetical protein
VAGISQYAAEILLGRWAAGAGLVDPDAGIGPNIKSIRMPDTFHAPVTPPTSARPNAMRP